MVWKSGLGAGDGKGVVKEESLFMQGVGRSKDLFGRAVTGLEGRRNPGFLIQGIGVLPGGCYEISGTGKGEVGRGGRAWFEFTMGRHTVSTPTPRARFVESSAFAHSARILNIPQVLTFPASLRLEARLLPVARSTPRVEADPRVFSCELWAFSG